MLREATSRGSPIYITRRIRKTRDGTVSASSTLCSLLQASLVTNQQSHPKHIVPSPDISTRNQKNEFDTKMPWFVGERPEAWSWEARELLAAARCATRVDMWARCSLEELSERLGWIVLGNQPPPWAACFQASSPGGAVPGGGEEGEVSWLVECPDVIVQGVSTPVVVKRSSCDGIGRGWGGGEGKCGLGDSVHLSLIPENEQSTTGGSPSTPEIGLGGAGDAGEVATWSAVVSIWRGFGVASVRVVRMPCSSPTETLEL